MFILETWQHILEFSITGLLKVPVAPPLPANKYWMDRPYPSKVIRLVINRVPSTLRCLIRLISLALFSNLELFPSRPSYRANAYPDPVPLVAVRNHGAAHA
jgi:hypothetical protein